MRYPSIETVLNSLCQELKVDKEIQDVFKVRIKIHIKLNFSMVPIKIK